MPRGRVLGLDGLRAVAVAAVVAYHLDGNAVPGGFLGVDVFFVLSGYLITSLLVGEWDEHGSIRLLPFWRRRVRRIVPLLLALVVGVGTVTPVLFADVAGRVRGELVAAVAQGGNWFEAFAGRSYFDGIGRASPLLHLWSLGVEAQFYAAWPVLAVIALGRGGRRALAWLAVAGGSASFLAMALAFHAGHDPSRLYYGTDTRAGTLLVGAVLALGAHRIRLRPAVTDLAGVAGLLGLGVLALRLDGTSAFAYRGGLLLAAVLGAVVVGAALQAEGRLGGALSARPLVWLGTRSYAVYLWHWPVIVATRPDVDLAVHGWALLALRLGLTLALAEGSMRVVDGVRTASWRTTSIGARRLVLAAAALLVVAAAVATQSPSTQPVFYVSPTTLAPTATSIAVTTSTEAPTTTAAPTTVPAPPTTAPVAVPPVHAVAVGESVLLAAGGDVQRMLGPGTVVDAAVGRQPKDVLDALDAERQAGHLDGIDTLVVQMGTNGVVRDRQLQRLATEVGGIRRVIAVTVRVDRPWEQPSNDALRGALARYPWLRLAEWHDAALAHPEWLGPDGVHPNRLGARQYADLVGLAVTAP